MRWLIGNSAAADFYGMRRCAKAFSVAGLAVAGAAFVLAPGVRADTCPVEPVVPGCSTTTTTTPPPTTPPTTAPALPPSTTTTTQPAQTPRPAPDTAAAARRLFDLVNAERTSRGLPALTWRVEITAIAAPHTAAMAAKYDIWHNDAYFTTATHNALAAVFLGENVAMNPSIDNMHQRLMNSPHHRDNILDGRFRQVGIAVAAASDGELFATEDFAQPRAAAAAPAPKPAPAPKATTTTPPTTATAVDAPSAELALDSGAVQSLPGSLVHPHRTNHTPRPAAAGLAGLAALAMAGLGSVVRFLVRT